jgi:PBSX family phage terminase large subunit
MTSEVRVSEVLAPNQHDFHRDVKAHEATHYWLAGGRGSTKSSAASIELWLTLIRNPGVNAVVLRKVAKTLRKSVYAQVKWAAVTLGLSDRIKATTSPMEIVYEPTGQKIVFEGLDEPEKIKSLKFESGYSGIVWFEEIDQFGGMEEVRNVQQSLLRGGDLFWCLYSFNPPRSRDNWVNKHLSTERPGNRVYRTDYRDVPVVWLGEQFLLEAEQLRELNETAYKHEYLGEVVGTGGNVFENVVLRTITDEEIATFDRVYNGVDFGFFPDPWVLGRHHYQKAQRRLFIFDEAHDWKLSDEQAANLIKQHLSDANGTVRREKVVCDSAEPKAIDKYRHLGINARGAVKGPGSVEHGMKWLATRVEIVIDPKRCPLHSEEFTSYEHERNAAGDYISSYPDENDHGISACRYGLEEVMNRRANV